MTSACVARRSLETVGFRAVQVDEPAPVATDEFSPTAIDDVRIHIHGVAGIRNRNDAVARIYVAEITKVTLGTIRNENLIGLYIAAACLVVSFGHCVTQEVISLFGAVTVESRFGSHIIHSFVHSLDGCLRNRKSHVTDIHTDYVNPGMSLTVFAEFGRYR